MPDRVPWTQRTFRFDAPVDAYQPLIERLRGAPDRAEAMVSGLSAELLRRRDGDTWSIQENIGHLADLEDLFTGRLDDFAAGLETLRPADMTNRKTNEARHNERPTGAVLAGFRARRADLVAQLQRLAPADFARAAMHPRLGQPMRVVDMLLFHAEHDDYHLDRVGELIARFEAAGGAR